MLLQVNSILPIPLQSNLLLNPAMREIRYIRQAKLLILEREYETLAALAGATGTSAGYLSQVKNDTRGMGNIVARKLEAGAGLQNGWMDADDGSDEDIKTIDVYPLNPIEKKLILFFRVLAAEQRQKIIDYILLSQAVAGSSNAALTDKRVLPTTESHDKFTVVAPTKNQHEELAPAHHEIREKYVQRHGPLEIDSAPDYPRLPTKRQKKVKRGTTKNTGQVGKSKATS